MKTAERILDSARRQLNEKGVAGLSLRDISADLQISLGNLTYHYPNKDTLMMALYKAYQAEVVSMLAQIGGCATSVLDYLNIHRSIFQVQERYKFLFLSLFEIMTQYPAIKEDYIAWMKQQRIFAEVQLLDFKEKGILTTKFTDANATRILDVGQILHSQWLVESEFVNFDDNLTRERHYLSVCCGLLEPYLSEDQLQDYQAFFEAYESAGTPRQ